MRNRLIAAVTFVRRRFATYRADADTGFVRLPPAAESHRRHARRAAAADRGGEPGARRHRAARARQHADHRRALAAVLPAGRRPHQSADQRAASRPALSQPHAEGDRRRQREKSHAAAVAGDRRGSASTPTASASRSRTCATTASSCGLAIPRPARRSRSRPRSSIRCSARRARSLADGTSLLCAFINANRGAAPQLPAAPTGPNVQESRGVVASVRDRAGHACQRARRSAVRVLRHQPARHR